MGTIYIVIVYRYDKQALNIKGTGDDVLLLEIKTAGQTNFANFTWAHLKMERVPQVNLTGVFA